MTIHTVITSEPYLCNISVKFLIQKVPEEFLKLLKLSLMMGQWCLPKLKTEKGCVSYRHFVTHGFDIKIYKRDGLFSVVICHQFVQVKSRIKLIQIV